MTLRGLDDRVLPVAARRLRRWLAAGRRVAARTAGLREHPGRTLRHPAAAAVLVVLAGGGVAAGLVAAGTGSHPAGSTGPPVGGYAAVGPTRGTSVTAYAAAAAERLRRLARQHPGVPAFAVVDLRSYLTPAEVGRLTGTLPVRRAYLHVRVPGLPTQVHAVTLASAADLAGHVAAAGATARQTAQGYRQLIAALGAPRNTQQQALLDAYRRRLRATEAEATRLTPGCRCVYALVVRGDAAALQRLAARPQVRVVDPAAPDVALDGLAAIAVLPETTGLVPVDAGFAP